MTVIHIWKYRKRSRLKPSSTNAPANLRKTHWVWRRIMDRYRAWVKAATAAEIRALPENPVLCVRWLECFDHFLDDMGYQPEDGQLVRMDPLLPYCKGNCSWVINPEAVPGTHSPVRYLTRAGKTQTLSDWAREKGIRRDILYTRIRTHGESAPDNLLFAPPARTRSF